MLDIYYQNIMKEYIKPELAVLDVLTENMIVMSFTAPEEEKDNVVAGSNKRRGSWGDLWE